MYFHTFKCLTNLQHIRSLFKLDVEGRSTGFIVYYEQPSERLSYTCEFIFSHVLGVNYSLTNSVYEFEYSTFNKINYSATNFAESFRIIPSGLLSESKLNTSFKPEAMRKQNKLYFFENGGDQGFDVFSAVFYFISRYEEWQDFAADVHLRFESKNSILFREKCHLKPVVDSWILELKAALEKFYPQCNFPQKQMQVISTIDVDNLYAYKLKGILRTGGAFAKDLLKGDISNARERLKVVGGKQKDPFDIYDGISTFCKEQKTPLFYFFLFRTGTKFDRTVDPASGAFKKVFDVIKKESAYIGLHPSYFSAYDEHILQNEVKLINSSLEEPVVFSRQHYLRFNIKTTPKQLLKNGIRVDFTMGFASTAGFRAGTSFPFYYYDFSSESKSELLFVPFCAMDGAYTVYNKTLPESALVEFEALKEEVRKVHGFYITVFHERSFSDRLYKGFGALYKKLHKKS